MKYLIISLLFISFKTYALDVKTYIPDKAYKYFDLIINEKKLIFNDFTTTHYFAALAEHESCIHLKHKRCWDPKSSFKTKRELGSGIFQLTKAYKKDGSIRFDSLKNIRRKYHNELKELTWDNITSRPDLQLKAMMLMIKDDYKKLYNVNCHMDRLAMTDAAYNGGLNSVYKRRRKCGLDKKCNPQKWVNNVELMVVKSTKPLYSGRSAQEINTYHPYDIIHNRMPKYKKYF